MPKLDLAIKSLKKDLEEVLNPNLLTEEKQMSSQIIGEKFFKLETKRHNRTCDNVATRSKLENETIGKYWININKERKPWDTLYKLRQLLKLRNRVTISVAH
jgi:hypothetical protein